MPLKRSANCNLFFEILVRVTLFSLFCYLETLPPFVRVILPSDMEDCKYPRTESYVSGGMLWGIVLTVPCLLSLYAWAVCNDCNDALEFLLAWSLAFGMTGCITDFVKLIVGRPRPDFFYRCFPDGIPTADMKCTGDLEDIIKGRKSFPSGHSSLSFTSLGIGAFWICGRLGVLSRRRGSSLRVMVSIAPLVVALSVALSRSCDYHHHWQDILVGSILGLAIANFCYNQYYNPLSSELSGVSCIAHNSCIPQYVNGKEVSPLKECESTPLLFGGKKEDKWI